MSEDFWIKFWNKNQIINNSDPQLQVGRSINKKPIDFKQWENTLQYIEELIKLNKGDSLLDLCAGNGLISIPFSEKCQQITAVDFSDVLIKRINSYKKSNIITYISDAREIIFPNESFNKIIIYFALQHFNERDTIQLFEKLFNWLKKDGLIFIGDIPDADRIWNFFNTREREMIYLNSIKNNQPVIGTWYNKEFLLKLSEHIGFKEYIALDQPKEQINSHYRFDLILKK